MSKTSILPFPITAKRAHATVDYSDILGDEFDVDLSTGPAIVRLCQLDLSGGTAVPLNKVFVGTTATGQPDHQVKPCEAQTDRPYGVGLTTEALVDNDYFFVQVSGIATVIKGDDASNAVVGQALRADNDADTGKVYNSTVTELSSLDLGYALATTSSTDDTVLVALVRKLLG